MNIQKKRRKAVFAFVVLASLIGSLGSCKKDDSTSNNNSNDTTVVTEEEVAQLASDAVTPDNGGFVAQTDNMIIMSGFTPIVCGFTKDSAIAAASAAGAARSFSYNFDWNYEVTCDGPTPKSLMFAFHGHSSFDGPRMMSSDSCNGGYDVTNLSPEYASYQVDAYYNRTGSQTSKIGHKSTFTSTLSISASGLVVDKLTRELKSGSAAVTVTGKSTTGKSFSYTGNILFMGGKTAKLTMASGASYAISW